MKDLIKICISPLTNKAFGICNEKDELEECAEKSCRTCTSKWYVSVDKLEQWIQALYRDGINSKHVVREEMKRIVKGIKKQEER